VRVIGCLVTWLFASTARAADVTAVSLPEPVGGAVAWSVTPPPEATAIARLARLGPKVPAPPPQEERGLAGPIAPDLHPVKVQYVRRTLDKVDEALAGPRASTIYRAPLSQLDLAFQMQSQNLPIAPFDDSFELRALGLLGAAFSVATQQVVADALADAPALAVGQKVLRTLTTPSLSLSKQRDGKTTLRATPVGAAQANLAAANLDQEVARRGRPASTFRTGAGMQMQTIDDDEETPIVDAAVWMLAQNVGVDAWRVSGLAISRTWSASARQHVVGPWHLTASTRSLSESPLPAVWQAGTLTELPGTWQLRTWYRETLPAVSDEYQEQEVGFELRALWRWRTPQPVDGWGLGNRVDRAGRIVPGSEYLEETALIASGVPVP
jgi:hypothetical protein